MIDYLRSIGVGQRSPRDEFFDDSYKACKILVRKGITVVDDEELCHKMMNEFSCSIPGCMETFQTLVDFEIHYNGMHRYICSKCKKSRPSSRLLDIHVQETHDSFFKVLAERQPMYQCYVSECEIKFKTPIERRDHCVGIHKYPKHFRFDDTVRRENKSNKNRSKSANKMEVDQHLPQSSKSKKINLNKNQKVRTFSSVDKKTVSENVIAERVANISEHPTSSTLVSRTSSLSFVPRQVMTYSKLLTKAKSSERDVLNNRCMMDLADSLPDAL